MLIDLHNFFKHYDEQNPKHVAAVQELENKLSSKLPEVLDDSDNWVRIYRTPQEVPRAITLNVPFFPQTDNYRDPSRTCNSSACAMCLEYFKPGTLKGPRGDDAYVRSVFAVGDTTDHSVQTRVLASYGVKSTFSYNLSFDALDKELENKRPVVIGILHRGSLSAPTGGHMICVIGKTADEKGYIVNDPYGSLNNGYSGPVTEGKGAVYSRTALQKRWTVDGPTTGWGRTFQ